MPVLSPPIQRTEYVTPEMYGAAGDGTTDDRTALNNTILKAIESGGRLYVRLKANARYYISERIDIDGVRGLRIVGDNTEILFQSDSGSLTNVSGELSAQQRRSALYFHNTAACSVRGVTFVGTGDNIVVSVGAGVYARRSKDLRVKDCFHRGGGSLFLQDPLDNTTGTGDSITVSGVYCTLADSAASFHAAMVGGWITISGATNKSNNGTFPVYSFGSTSSIVYVNANGVTETSSFSWRTDDGDMGARVVDCVSINPHGFCSAGLRDTIFARVKHLYDLSHADQIGRGNGATLTLVSTTVTLTDPRARFKPFVNSRYVIIADATTPANNGKFQLTYVSATEISWTNASGATEAFGGTWWIPCGDRTGLGNGASAISVSAGVVTFTASAAIFKPSDVQHAIRLTGATSQANNVSAAIDTYISPTQVTFRNPLGVSESYSGVFTIDYWDNALDASSNTCGSTHSYYIFGGRQDVTWDGCVWEGPRTNAIKASGTNGALRNLKVVNSTFRECALGVLFGADDSNEHSGLIVTGCYFEDCGTQRGGWGGGGSAVSLLGSQNVSIRGNKFHDTREAIGSVNGQGIANNVTISASRYAEGVSQPVDDLDISDNIFTADVTNTLQTGGSKIRQFAMQLKSVGLRAKYASDGTLTKSGSTMTLTSGSAKFNSILDVGKTITLVNAPNAGNNGTFTILSVPSTTTLTFTNSGGTGGAVAAGTYRIGGFVKGGSLTVRRNTITNCATTGISTENSVGPEITENIVSGCQAAIRINGDVSPRVAHNRELDRRTISASLQLYSGTSWPVLNDNMVTNQADGVSSARGMGVGLDGSTPVDWPLSGVRGRALPTSAFEEVVVSYGSKHVDGDTINVNGTTYTYKASSPGASEFNTCAGLIALITAQTGFNCEDYGASFSTPVTTSHIRIRADAASHADGSFTVTVSALNPTALVLWRNDSSPNTTCYSRGSGTGVGNTPDKIVAWSQVCDWNGVTVVVPDNADARTILQTNGPALPVKNSNDSGCCEVLNVGDCTGKTPEFRWAMGAN